MLIYVCLFVVLLIIYQLAYSRGYEDPKKRFLVWSAVLLILLFGSVHNQYGFPDTGMYYNLYRGYIGRPFSVAAIDSSSFRDSAFFFMTWCLAQIVRWPQFYVFFEAAVVICTLFWFIYRNSENPFLSITVLFGSGLLNFCLSAYRQAMALSLCIVAYELMKCHSEKKPWKKILGLVIYIIGIFMHRSAITFAFVFIINAVNRVGLKLFLASIGALFLWIYGEQLFQFGAELMEKSYVAEFHMSYVGHTIQLIFLITPVILLIIARYFAYLKDMQQKEKYHISNETSIVIGSILCCVFYSLRTIAQGYERLAFYFFPFTVISYSTALDYSVSENSKKFTGAFVCILCIALFLWRQSSTLIRGFIFFWQR